MAYITASDLSKRLTPAELVQVADLDGDDTGDPEVITQAITDAESLVNSYVGKRLTTPLTAVPDAIIAVCLNMAVYNLYRNRRSVTEDMREQYREDMKYLRDVATGKVALGDEDDAATATAPAVRHEVNDRAFSREKMDRW